MSGTITIFGTLNPPQATGAQLDNNLALVSAQAPIPCTASGSNVITLTQNSNVYTVTGYVQNMQVSFIVTSSNTGPTQAGISGLGSRSIYKDTPAGATALNGNELIQGNAATLMYDTALNGGAGGWHLFSSAAITDTNITPSSVTVNDATLTNLLSGTVSLTFAAVGANTSEDQSFSLTGPGFAVPHVGDFVQVIPPSLAPPGIGYNAMITGVGSITASTSAATVNVRAFNVTAASVSPPSGIYRYVASRYSP